MQKKIKKILLITLLIGIIPSFSYSQEPEQKFQGFNLQGYTEEGEKSWDVVGDTADIIGSEVVLKNVDANTYGDDKVNLTAETGILDQNSGNMKLKQDVVVVNEDGAQLMTDSLDYNRSGDLVTTDDEVLIKNKGFTVTGKGMKARPGLKDAQIKEDVTVMINSEPEKEVSKFITITSDGPMVIDQAKSIATFEKNVVAVQEDQILKADLMEIYFNMKTNKIKEIVCKGNVLIEQGENQTFADKAVYNANTQRITLSGRPKLILQTEGEDAFTSFGN